MSESQLASTQLSHETPHDLQRTIVAGIAGNVMEWYDFAVYGYFAAIIGQHFFPSEDPTASVIASFGAFAAGFLMRPFGGFIFGHIGDKYGRKRALTLSVILMAVPTFLIGVLPGHAQIGVTASVLLVLLRMLQGLSVGGEYTTSITFLVEHGDQKKRGFMGSWSIFGAVAGILLGSAVGAALAASVSVETLADWGWRLPFLFGLAIGFTGLYIRRHMAEDPASEEAQAKISPVILAFRDEWRAMLQIAGFNVVNAVGFYMIFVYAVTWLHQTAHISTSRALDINTASMVVLLILIPIIGRLSDKVGRRPLLLTAVTGLLLLSYPLMWLMHHDQTVLILSGQLGFAVLIGLIFGAYPAAMVEMVPKRVRVSTMSIGYNLCLGLVGGTTPIVATYLIARTNVDLAPAFYLMAAAALSLLVVLKMKETARDHLR